MIAVLSLNLVTSFLLRNKQRLDVLADKAGGVTEQNDLLTAYNV